LIRARALGLFSGRWRHSRARLDARALVFFRGWAEPTMADYLLAVLAMTALGGFFGFLLAYAARRLAVPVDPRMEAVDGMLPGANCGGCGFAGCRAFAEAVTAGNAGLTLCAPGGQELPGKIGGVLGVEVSADPGGRPVAWCACQRKEVAIPYDYRGIRTCRAASAGGLSGGPLACRFGCLGFGDCVAVCAPGALEPGGEGQPIRVDAGKCLGCRKCVAACPRGLMLVAPIRETVRVACRSRDRGAVAGKLCAHACIACRRCERVCKREAIRVQDNLAEIDAARCDGCGECVRACLKKCITARQRPAAAETAETAEAAETAAGRAGAGG